MKKINFRKTLFAAVLLLCLAGGIRGGLGLVFLAMGVAAAIAFRGIELRHRKNSIALTAITPPRSASAQQLRSFWRFCRLTDAAYRLRVKRNGRKEQLVKCGFAPPIFIGLP